MAIDFPIVCLLLVGISAPPRMGARDPPLFTDVAEVMRQNLQWRPSSSNFTIINLPDTAKPVSYVLNINSNSVADTTSGVLRGFSGSVSIEIILISRTQQIILHSSDLRISSVKLINERSGKELAVVYFLRPEDEILYISILDSVSSESFRCRLTIEFSGRLNNKQMIGFYRTWYKVGAQTRWLAVTQFQPTFARMAFPCFDEPRFKTPFTVSIVRRTHQTSLSNMPISHQTTDHISDTVTDFFFTSPMMPTYLVAFAVFEFRTVKETNGSVRVWARDSVIEFTGHALSTVPKLLHHMETYTTIPYSLPKMDLLAVPRMDFPAMEHWGLLTFSEQYFLYDERINTQTELIQSICVVAHEIAHQWFGNYVTCDSWNYIWLNEGFARFFESKLTAEVESSWRMNDYFVAEFMHRVLFEDGATLRHPLTKEVRTSNDIMNSFDLITYDKGGSVTPSDLWREFEVQLQKPSNTSWIQSNNLTDVMTHWTTQVGYPLIIVSKRQNDILLQQETYDASRRSTLAANSVVDADSRWAIPVSYSTKSSVNLNDTRPALIFNSKQATLPIRVQAHDWILVNIQQTGYYRVLYDSENWKLLTRQLLQDYSLIHPLNRAQLIDDSFSLAIDMKLAYTIPLFLSTYLRAEMDVIPWVPALRKIDFLFEQYQGTLIEDLLQVYASNLLRMPFSRVGFFSRSTDGHGLRMLRALIAPYACRTGVELCKRAVEREYSKNVADLSQITQDAKETVFCVTLRDGDETDNVWHDLWRLYRRSNSAREKEAILRALGCTRNADHLRAYVRMLVNEDIRQEYHRHAIKALCSSAAGVTAILSHIQDTIKNITSRTPNELRAVTFLVKIGSERATTEDHLNFFRGMAEDVKKLPDRRFGVGSLINAIVHANHVSEQRVERNRLVEESLRSALQKINNSAYDSTAILLHCLGCLIVLMTWICYV